MVCGLGRFAVSWVGQSAAEQVAQIPRLYGYGLGNLDKLEMRWRHVPLEFWLEQPPRDA